MMTSADKMMWLQVFGCSAAFLLFIFLIDDAGMLR